VWCEERANSAGPGLSHVRAQSALFDRRAPSPCCARA